MVWLHRLLFYFASVYINVKASSLDTEKYTYTTETQTSSSSNSWNNFSNKNFTEITYKLPPVRQHSLHRVRIKRHDRSSLYDAKQIENMKGEEVIKQEFDDKNNENISDNNKTIKYEKIFRFLQCLLFFIKRDLWEDYKNINISDQKTVNIKAMESKDIEKQSLFEKAIQYIQKVRLWIKGDKSSSSNTSNSQDQITFRNIILSTRHFLTLMLKCHCAFKSGNVKLSSTYKKPKAENILKLIGDIIQPIHRRNGIFDSYSTIHYDTNNQNDKNRKSVHPSYFLPQLWNIESKNSNPIRGSNYLSPNKIQNDEKQMIYNDNQNVSNLYKINNPYGRVNNMLIKQYPLRFHQNNMNYHDKDNTTPIHEYPLYSKKN